jgi:uncharacterized protein (TIGR02246 family)
LQAHDDASGVLRNMGWTQACFQLSDLRRAASCPRARSRLESDLAVYDAASVGTSPETFQDWLERYFQAWVSNDPEQVAALFTADAVYWVDPFTEPRRGRDEIVSAWLSGPQEEVEYEYEVLAVTGDVGIAHWRVSSRTPGASKTGEIDGILLIGFAEDGRCREHREWYSRRELEP